MIININYNYDYLLFFFYDSVFMKLLFYIIFFVNVIVGIDFVLYYSWIIKLIVYDGISRIFL